MNGPDLTPGDDIEQLKVREARLRAIVETAPTCLARVSRDATILAMNVAGRSMLGATRGRDILKKSILSFVVAEDQERARQLIEGACDGQAASAEFSMNGPAGGRRSVEASAVSLSASGDVSATALMTFRDVTGRRRLEHSVEDDLEHRLSESEARSRGLEVERDALAARADAALSEAHALSERLLALEVTDRGLEEECDELRREVDDRRREVEEGHRVLDAGRHELDEARRELKARQCAIDLDFARLDEERSTLQRLIQEQREREATLIAAPAMVAATDHSPRLAEIEAECSRLMAERDRLLSSAGDARAEMRALDERLQAHEAAHGAVVAERDELKRSLAAARTEHATEMAAAFADRAALERRVHDRDVLHAELEVARKARDQAIADREAAMRSLEDLQQYEKAARRWITQWFELEQALHTARSEFQQLAEWARGRNERMAPPATHALASEPITATDGSGR